MLFTLTTLKIREKHLVQQIIERWSKNLFSRNNDAQSVANGDRCRIKIRLR